MGRRFRLTQKFVQVAQVKPEQWIRAVLSVFQQALLDFQDRLWRCLLADLLQQLSTHENVLTLGTRKEADRDLSTA